MRPGRVRLLLWSFLMTAGCLVMLTVPWNASANGGLGSAYVLGTDGNLWLESGPFGTVPPSRVQIDANVAAVSAVSNTQAYVLGTDGNLWLENAPFGAVPPSRIHIDANVAAVSAVSNAQAYVLGADGNLWLENAPFGTVPPARVQVDANVKAVSAPVPAPSVSATAPSTPATTILRPPPPPPHRRHAHRVRALRVKIALTWQWRGSLTRLLRVTFGRLPRRAKLTIVCRGRGCPRHGVSALASRFAHRLRTGLGPRYQAGDRLLLSLSAAHYTAERARISIRRGQIPAARLLS